MSNENQIPFNQDLRESESQSLKRDLFRYLKYWKWILFGAIAALIVSHIYLRYAPRIYQTKAKIKILKKKDSGLDLSGLTGNSPLFDMSQINLDNEMQVLQSRRIIGQVVDNLKLETYYFTTGRIKETELFGSQTPIMIEWLNKEDSDFSKSSGNIFIYEPLDNETYRLKIFEKEYNKAYKYGEEVKYENAQFIVQKNPFYQSAELNNTNLVNFTFKSKNSLINRYLGSVNTEPVGDKSEVIELKITGQNTEKNEAVLNNLIDVFNEDGVRDDNRVAIRTVNFVTEKLAEIESELDTVESDLVNFKRNNDFIGVSSGSSTIFKTYSEAEQSRADLQNQLQISRFLQEEITKNSQYALFPANIGLQNDNTNSLIDRYNEIVQERNKLLASSTETNPTVITFSEQLRDLNRNIQESIENYIKSIQITLENISRRENQFNSSIKAIPEKEKVARGIQRQQAVKENLYIFLLQKQVEADLAAAITAPTAKVVDYAYSGSGPVSPRPNVIYLAGLVIGLGIPIGILYIIYLFDTKVTSKEQIQAKLDIPIIAEIPINKEYDGKIIKATDNSNVAEAFRILRTNMSYLITEDNERAKDSKVIFSTSSTKGEGKTFSAINSASVFASNNHKTLLVGCDLRNPQLHNYLGVSKKNIGLSSFLVDQELKLNDVIFKTEKNLNFDIILSGEIPPNPSELLNNGRLEELIAEAREIYDYIIIDTAPTMLVTDTLTIVDQADAIIYMIRANFTELKILRHVKELTKFNMKKNIGIAINAVDEKRGYEYNYGYGYGYGIDTKVKKWYQFR